MRSEVLRDDPRFTQKLSSNGKNREKTNRIEATKVKNKWSKPNKDHEQIGFKPIKEPKFHEKCFLSRSTQTDV